MVVIAVEKREDKEALRDALQNSSQSSLRQFFDLAIERNHPIYYGYKTGQELIRDESGMVTESIYMGPETLIFSVHPIREIKDESGKAVESIYMGPDTLIFSDAANGNTERQGDKAGCPAPGW